MSELYSNFVTLIQTPGWKEFMRIMAERDVLAWNNFRFDPNCNLLEMKFRAMERFEILNTVDNFIREFEENNGHSRNGVKKEIER